MSAVAHALDVVPLWNFADPAASEARFRAALATATGDDALVLRTQIVRTYALRGDIVRARAELAAIEPALATAGPEARARYWLERGRTYASATTPPEQQTDVTRKVARDAFGRALAIASAARLDDLAIDAIHMDAFVDTAPENQLRRGREALAIATTSSQPAARRWEASLRNNVGYALHELGRYDEALGEFDKALALRQAAGNAAATREAEWMVAWTLRALHRDDEALAMQLALERAADEAGQPDADIYGELEVLYRAKGDVARADMYAARKARLGERH